VVVFSIRNRWEMLRLFIIMAVVFIGACDSESEITCPQAETLPLTTIYNNENYNKKQVTISGFLVRRESPIGLYLYPYEIDAINDDITKEVRILFKEGKIPDSIKDCLEQYVLVTGNFYAKSKTKVAQISPTISVSLLKIEESNIFAKRCYDIK